MINLIENLCRTCMGEEESVYITTPKRQSNNHLISIFNGPRQTMDCGSISILEILKHATPQLSIDKEDLLPKSICKNCLDNLVNIHQFQQKCLLTEQRLHDLMNESTFAKDVTDNEDDPLTNSEIQDLSDLHNILKIEIDDNAKAHNDIVVINSKLDYDVGGTNEKKENCDDVDHLQSNAVSCSKKTTRKRKLARNRNLKNIEESTDKINKLLGCEEKLFACKECGSCLKTLNNLKRHEKVHCRTKIGQKKPKIGESQYDDFDNSEEDISRLNELVTINRESSLAKNQDTLKNIDIKDSQLDATKSLLGEVQGSEEKSFGCDDCGSRLKTRKSLNRHQKIHQKTQIEEKEKPEYTWQFGSGEDTNEDYDPHDIYNDDETTSKTRKSTEETKKDADQSDSLEPAHKHQVQDDDKLFECDECGSRVKTRKSLQRHKRIHLRLPGEKAQRSKTKYECKYCQKVFCQSSSLKDHMRVHTGEKPFLCSECGKAFKILSNMKQHFLRHGTDRPYECPDCPKKFPCLTDLASHAAVHNKAKTHVCDICGSAFVKPYLLKKHKMYHTGKKNHKCDYCDMRFVLAEQCRRHMRTHTGEKPYKCKYCSRAFAQSNDLTKHLRVHLGDSVYKCDMCPQGFRLLGDLRAHFNTHKNDDEETRLKNLQALKEDELRLQLRFGLVQTKNDIQ